MTSLVEIVPYVVVILSIFLLGVIVVSIVKKDNGIMDIAYGPGFILIAACLGNLWPDWNDRQWILVFAVAAWGFRLALRIFLRHWNKPEDFRYHAWREAWMKKGMLYFFVRSLVQIYLLQGTIILIVSLPILLVFSSVQSPLEWFNWLGLGLWCLGFFFEVVGDWQLDRFVRKPENKGKIMTTGLWRYTRHPNYFGEATMWWGLALVVLGLPNAPIALLSPLLITFLLTQVSGIPMLEKHFAGRPDWEIYKAKTSAFLPWLTKKEIL